MNARKMSGMRMAVALSAVVVVAAAGCGKPDDGMSQAQLQKADRLSEIAKQSDGDWNRVSQADRDYILQNFTSGSESGAQMLLKGKAGKLRGGPGGAPGPGGPPGAGGPPPAPH